MTTSSVQTFIFFVQVRSVCYAYECVFIYLIMRALNTPEAKTAVYILPFEKTVYRNSN